MLKEKLKLINSMLKLWHQNHTQSLEGKIKVVKYHISFLDIKGDEQVLLFLDLLHFTKQHLGEVFKFAKLLQDDFLCIMDTCWIRCHNMWVRYLGLNQHAKLMCFG